MSYITFVNGKSIDVHDIDEVCENLKLLFKHEQDKAEQAQAQYEELKKESWRDDILNKMKQERDQALKERRLGFAMTQEECNRIREWKNQHIKEKHFDNQYGATGGSYKYIFTPTFMGVSGEIECTCGDKFCFRKLD